MKLTNIKPKAISESFQFIILEGPKANWIALNQGDKLIARINRNNDKQMIGKTAQQVADHLEQEGGKYAPFYSKLYLSGDVKKMEDFYRLAPLIKQFEQHKRYIENKDISGYTLKSLTKALEPFKGKISHRHVNPAEDDVHLKNKDMTRHISTPTFEVIVPHTEETACHLGKGTDWCTAADEDHNMFDHYAQDGNLYVIRAGDRRFQLHYESGSFMDEKDEDVSEKDIEYLSGFPQYKQFLDMMIKKHYFDKDIMKHEYRD